MSLEADIDRICAAAEVAIISCRNFQIGHPGVRVFEAWYLGTVAQFDICSYIQPPFYRHQLYTEYVRQILRSVITALSEELAAKCRVYAQRRGGLA